MVDMKAGRSHHYIEETEPNLERDANAMTMVLSPPPADPAMLEKGLHGSWGRHPQFRRSLDRFVNGVQIDSWSSRC